MDESRGKQGVVHAWFVLGIIFIIFIIALSKFGKDKTTVYNQQINPSENVTREQVMQELKNQQDSELWGKYIDKIFSETKSPSEDLSSEFQKELENKVLLPEESLQVLGNIVGNSYSERAKYLNDFETLFIGAGKRGVLSEAKLFASQAGETGAVLELSDYDRETILRIATEYELWAKEILNLDTPGQYENRSLRVAQDILQVAYILRKAIAEDDTQVYVMWIGKYTQKVFDILASRYVK